jgi:hypothetical protein
MVMRAPISIRMVSGAQGVPLMKLTLTFEGELPSTGNSPRKASEKKWIIRKAFHPQLAEACQVHPALRSVMEHGTLIPLPGQVMILSQFHHNDPMDRVPARRSLENRDLCSPIQVGERTFIPIVRESLALGCELKILFLRREDPGSLVLQDGDLDNRLKTLFDALRVPTEAELVEDPTLDNPVYCLLESDTLITGLSIKTDRLLTGANKSPHEAHLIIEADIRVLQAKLYNLAFLGD